jgi:gamma-glutamylaminecyclotransferase
MISTIGVVGTKARGIWGKIVPSVGTVPRRGGTMGRSMSIHLFVYGTLKEGFPNFGLNTGTRMAGSFTTAERYPLYLVGEHCLPCMINTPGQGEYVVGQVFEVQPEVLERMDILERVNEPDGYERIQIRVKSQSSEPRTERTVLAYLMHPQHLAGASVLAGPFSEYTTEHAALYRQRAP